jgi:hypothetical protein
MVTKNTKIIVLVVTAVLMVAAYTQLTLFIIPPIGAVPEGKTIVITRMNKTNFIDSPDGMCDRMQGGVSLMCRGMAVGAVLNKSTILLRLPYSRALYLASTDGKTYDR